MSSLVPKDSFDDSIFPNQQQYRLGVAGVPEDELIRSKINPTTEVKFSLYNYRQPSPEYTTTTASRGATDIDTILSGSGYGRSPRYDSRPSRSPRRDLGPSVSAYRRPSTSPRPSYQSGRRDSLSSYEGRPDSFHRELPVPGPSSSHLYGARLSLPSSTNENEMKKKIKNLEETVSDYERQKHSVMGTFKDFRERLAEKERMLEAEYSTKIISLSEEVLAAKRDFENRMKEYHIDQEKAEKSKEQVVEQLKEDHQKEIQHLEKRCSESHLIPDLERKYIAEITRLDEERRTLKDIKERLSACFESKLKRAQSLYENELLAAKALYSNELAALKDHEAALRQELTGREEEFRDQLENLQSHFNANRAELTKCKMEIQQLEETLQRKDKEFTEISAQLESVRTDNGSMANKLHHTRHEYQVQAGQMAEQSEQLRRKDDTIATLDKAKRRLEEIISELRGETEKLRTKIVFLESERKNLESQTYAQTQEQETQLLLLQKLAETLSQEKQRDLAEFEHQIETEKLRSEERFYRLEKAHKEEIEALERHHRQFKDDMERKSFSGEESIREHIEAEYRGRIEELKSQNKGTATELSRAREELEARLTAANDEIETLKNKISQKSSDIQAAKKLYSESNIEALNADNFASDLPQSSTMDADLSIREKVEMYEQRDEEYKVQAKQYEDKISQLEAALSAASSKQPEPSSSSAELLESMESPTEEDRALLATIEQLRSTVSKLESEIDELRCQSVDNAFEVIDSKSESNSVTGRAGECTAANMDRGSEATKSANTLSPSRHLLVEQYSEEAREAEEMEKIQQQKGQEALRLENEELHEELERLRREMFEHRTKQTAEMETLQQSIEERQAQIEQMEAKEIAKNKELEDITNAGGSLEHITPLSATETVKEDKSKESAMIGSYKRQLRAMRSAFEGVLERYIDSSEQVRAEIDSVERKIGIFTQSAGSCDSNQPSLDISAGSVELTDDTPESNEATKIFSNTRPGPELFDKLDALATRLAGERQEREKTHTKHKEQHQRSVQQKHIQSTRPIRSRSKDSQMVAKPQAMGLKRKEKSIAGRPEPSKGSTQSCTKGKSIIPSTSTRSDLPPKGKRQSMSNEQHSKAKPSVVKTNDHEDQEEIIQDYGHDDDDDVIEDEMVDQAADITKRRSRECRPPGFDRQRKRNSIATTSLADRPGVTPPCGHTCSRNHQHQARSGSTGGGINPGIAHKWQCLVNKLQEEKTHQQHLCKSTNQVSETSYIATTSLADRPGVTPPCGHTCSRNHQHQARSGSTGGGINPGIAHKWQCLVNKLQEEKTHQQHLCKSTNQGHSRQSSRASQRRETSSPPPSIASDTPRYHQSTASSRQHSQIGGASSTTSVASIPYSEDRIQSSSSSYTSESRRNSNNSASGGHGRSTLPKTTGKTPTSEKKPAWKF